MMHQAVGVVPLFFYFMYISGLIFFFYSALGSGTMIGFHCESQVKAHIIQQQTVAILTELHVKGPKRGSCDLKYVDKQSPMSTPTATKIKVPIQSGDRSPVSMQGTVVHSTIFFVF